MPDQVRDRIRDQKLTGIANAQGKIARNIIRAERRIANGKPGKMAKGLLEVNEAFCKRQPDGQDVPDGSEDATDTPEPDDPTDGSDDETSAVTAQD